MLFIMQYFYAHSNNIMHSSLFVFVFRSVCTVDYKRLAPVKKHLVFESRGSLICLMKFCWKSFRMLSTLDCLSSGVFHQLEYQRDTVHQTQVLLNDYLDSLVCRLHVFLFQFLTCALQQTYSCVVTVPFLVKMISDSRVFLIVCTCDRV